MKLFWYILVLATALLISCRKKDFPKTDPDLQGDFYFNGTVAGNAVSLKAGVDNYYMYSSHLFDNGSYYRFVADLRPGGCTACSNGIQVIINDFRISPATAS